MTHIPVASFAHLPAFAGVTATLQTLHRVLGTALARVYGSDATDSARVAIDDGRFGEALEMLRSAAVRSDRTPTSESDVMIATAFLSALADAKRALLAVTGLRRYYAFIDLKGRHNLGLCQVLEERVGARRRMECWPVLSDDPRIEVVWDDTCWRVQIVEEEHARAMIDRYDRDKANVAELAAEIERVAQEKFGADAMVVVFQDVVQEMGGSWMATVYVDGNRVAEIDHQDDKSDALDALGEVLGVASPVEIERRDATIAEAMMGIYANSYADDVRDLDGARDTLHRIQQCASKFVDVAAFRAPTYVPPEADDVSDAFGVFVAKCEDGSEVPELAGFVESPESVAARLAEAPPVIEQIHTRIGRIKSALGSSPPTSEEVPLEERETVPPDESIGK